MSTPIASRDQIDSRYQWDLSNIFPSDDAFLAALDAAKAYPERIAALKGTVAASAQGLLAFLQLDDEVDVALGKLANYAQRKSDEDIRVARYQDFSSQVTTLCVEIAGADKLFGPARAEYIVGQPEIAVSSTIVENPVAVRYAFRNVPDQTTLYNTGGLPAFPFRTDDWNDAQ